LPHPALSKGEGSEKLATQVLSFGEDLGEARIQIVGRLTPHKILLYPDSNWYAY